MFAESDSGSSREQSHFIFLHILSTIFLLTYSLICLLIDINWFIHTYIPIISSNSRYTSVYFGDISVFARGNVKCAMVSSCWFESSNHQNLPCCQEANFSHALSSGTVMTRMSRHAVAFRTDPLALVKTEGLLLATLWGHQAWQAGNSVLNSKGLLGKSHKQGIFHCHVWLRMV